MTEIHPTALVDAAAKLGANVHVGPYSIIESDTVIGDDCDIHAHAIIRRYTRIGRANQIYENVVLGGEPQDTRFRECVSWLDIGERNLIREGVTIHRSSTEGASTRIGDDNMLMANCHIAHDCRIGSGISIANGTLLAGHVSIDDRAFVSGAVTIHQFCRIGRLAMISQSTRVTMDCLPFTITEGLPARARGVNVVGLKRAGFTSDEIAHVRRALHALRAGASLDEAIAQMRSVESSAVSELVHFIGESKRGFVHPGN